MASLNFVSTNRVDVGSPAALDDMAVGSFLAWLKPTTTAPATASQIFNKQQTGVHFFQISTVPSLRSVIQRATTNLAVSASPGNCPGFGANKWCFVCVTWDTAGANSAQKIFTGDRQTLADEPSAYIEQQAGSGAISTNAANSLFIGNNSAGSNSLQGDIALAMMVDRQMTLGEARRWQWQPSWVSGTVGLWVLGRNGTTSVQDLSGNGHTGTITGATVAPGCPVSLWTGARAASLPYVVTSSPADPGYYYRLLMAMHSG